MDSSEGQNLLPLTCKSKQ